MHLPPSRDAATAGTDTITTSTNPHQTISRTPVVAKETITTCIKSERDHH